MELKQVAPYTVADGGDFVYIVTMFTREVPEMGRFLVKPKHKTG